MLRKKFIDIFCNKFSNSILNNLDFSVLHSNILGRYIKIKIFLIKEETDE